MPLSLPVPLALQLSSSTERGMSSASSAACWSSWYSTSQGPAVMPSLVTFWFGSQKIWMPSSSSWVLVPVPSAGTCVVVILIFGGVVLLRRLHSPDGSWPAEYWAAHCAMLLADPASASISAREDGGTADEATAVHPASRIANRRFMSSPGIRHLRGCP